MALSPGLWWRNRPDSDVDDALAELEDRHEALRHSHTKLQEAIATSVKARLEALELESSIVKTFANMSMVTVVAWMLSQTCSYAIALAMIVDGAETRYSNLLSRTVYAVVMTVLVPCLDWTLRGFAKKPSASVLRDQVNLLKACLPMFFAWAWKDVVGAVIALEEPGGRVPAALTVAVGLTLVIGLCEGLPCYARAVRDLELGGRQDTVLRRLITMPGKMPLAVGFAWNEVLVWAPRQLQGMFDEPLFVVMVQMVYYFVVTSVITSISLKWHMLHKSSLFYADHRHQHVEEGLGHEVVHAGASFAFKSGEVFNEALEFVFAWAQLDSLNALFFTYLVGCTSVTKCTFQSTFAFALALTVLFTRMMAGLKAEHRQAEWNKTASHLVKKSMTLNVGWAWSNYCATAVGHAVGNQQKVAKVFVYIITSLFAWLVISVIHRRFEIEHRAWERNVKQQTLNSGLVASLPVPTRRQLETQAEVMEAAASRKSSAQPAAPPPPVPEAGLPGEPPRLLPCEDARCVSL